MPISFLMDGSNDRRNGKLRHDIQTWLHFYSRSVCEIHQEGVDDEDGANLIRLTVEFRDPRDEADFWLWRGISCRGCRS
jgi:hypothetical protein